MLVGADVKPIGASVGVPEDGSVGVRLGTGIGSAGATVGVPVVVGGSIGVVEGGGRRAGPPGVGSGKTIIGFGDAITRRNTSGKNS